MDNRQPVTLVSCQAVCKQSTFETNQDADPVQLSHKPDRQVRKDNRLCRPKRCGRVALLQYSLYERRQLVQKTAAPAAGASRCTAVIFPTLTHQHSKTIRSDKDVFFKHTSSRSITNHNFYYSGKFNRKCVIHFWMCILNIKTVYFGTSKGFFKSQKEYHNCDKKQARLLYDCGIIPQLLSDIFTAAVPNPCSAFGSL